MMILSNFLFSVFSAASILSSQCSCLVSSFTLPEKTVTTKNKGSSELHVSSYSHPFSYSTTPNTNPVSSPTIRSPAKARETDQKESNLYTYLMNDFKTSFGEVINPYETLNIKESSLSATSSTSSKRNDIKRSYYSLMKQYHPDSQSTSRQYNAKDFERIQLAYKILMSPKLRTRYDRNMFLLSVLEGEKETCHETFGGKFSDLREKLVMQFTGSSNNEKGGLLHEMASLVQDNNSKANVKNNIEEEKKSFMNLDLMTLSKIHIELPKLFTIEKEGASLSITHKRSHSSPSSVMFLLPAYSLYNDQPSETTSEKNVKKSFFHTFDLAPERDITMISDFSNAFQSFMWTTVPSIVGNACVQFTLLLYKLLLMIQKEIFSNLSRVEKSEH